MHGTPCMHMHTGKQAWCLVSWLSFCCSAVWFFPSNLAHTVVGLEEGCEYVAGCALLIKQQGQQNMQQQGQQNMQQCSERWMRPHLKQLDLDEADSRPFEDAAPQEGKPSHSKRRKGQECVLDNSRANPGPAGTTRATSRTTRRPSRSAAGWPPCQRTSPRRRATSPRANPKHSPQSNPICAQWMSRSRGQSSYGEVSHIRRCPFVSGAGRGRG